MIYNNDKEKVQLDEVRLKDNEVSKKQFAVYIRDSKNEEYKEYNEDNLFPVGYKLDLEQSGCVDSDGNKVTEEGIISQTEDNKITLKSNKTVYCYLYFEKNSFNGTGKELAQSESKGLIATPGKGDLAYRYVGTKDDVENYICFGTTTKNDCTSEDSNYLYRIIGVDNSDRLKLIKDTALSTSAEWHKNYTDNAVWDTNSGKTSAKLYTDLNSTTFLDSTTYVPNGWKDKIDKTNWKIGDSNEDKATNGDAIWTWEQKSTVTMPFKIGLMYLSDYYYSLDGEGKTNCRDGGDSDYAKCKTSWLHISNNGDSSTISTNEWTMSRYGYSSIYGGYSAWFVYSTGQSYWYSLGITYAIRPVFYLTADSVIKGGSGTSNDPYILESPEEKGNRIATEKFGEVPAHFNTTPTGDMYRFVGTQAQSESINNYVCFGTNDCKKEATNDHLYRIIGITDGGNLKIQKNSAIGTSDWWTDYSTDKSWKDSKIYELLTGNSFYTSDTYVSSEMKAKIDENHKWNTGDVNIANPTSGDTVYNAEYNSSSSKHTGAVGIAYMSDYYFAYNEGGIQNCSSSQYCKSWLIPSDATSSGSTLWSSQPYEWTMTRYGRDSNGNYYAWYVDYNGIVHEKYLYYMDAVRPVFFLKSDVKLTTNNDSSDPKGSLKNPWIVDLQ